MSAAFLDKLLSGYTRPIGKVNTTPAKAANPAKREQPCGLPVPSQACEGLRISAKTDMQPGGGRADSQVFAGVRNAPTTSQTEQTSGPSHDSQDSQGCAAIRVFAEALAAVAWTDDDIGRYLDRHARLLRWGWSDVDAEVLAERLAHRDREGDERVSCADCRHYRPGRCANHGAAGLTMPDVGRDLAALLQRCAGFNATR